MPFVIGIKAFDLPGPFPVEYIVFDMNEWTDLLPPKAGDLFTDVLVPRDPLETNEALNSPVNSIGLLWTGEKVYP